MRLNKIDVLKINKGKPAHLRLYDIGSLTDEEMAFMSDLHRVVPKVSVANSCKELIDTLRLQYGKVITDVPNLFIAEKTDYYIELYITTVCNLACNNCAQFSQYRQTWYTFGLDEIRKFIDENKGKSMTVNILGGEPTIHPDIDEIVKLLSEHFTVGLATNGLTNYVPPVLIFIEDTSKSKGLQPMFSTTMEAPIDMEQYKNDDFSLGCYQAGVCGAGYNQRGYYACPIAGAIDRVMKLGYESKSIEEAYERQDEVFDALCRYCGTYKTKNLQHFLVPPLTDEEVITKSWEFIRE